MLYLFGLHQFFINFMQSGMYLDYITKKLSEMIARNVFIYSAIFFGEKFVIEFICKKTVDNLTTFFHINGVNNQYEHGNLYHNMVVASLSLLVFAEYWFLFMV